MAHFLAVFSPDTHAAFTASDRRVMGFKDRQRKAAARVGEGDLLLCYVTGSSRWTGVLRIDGPAYEDASPRFVAGEDPYVVRLPVTALVWLPVERGVAIREPEVWAALSFTREHPPRSSTWTGALRTSLAPIKVEDAGVIEQRLRRAQG